MILFIFIHCLNGSLNDGFKVLVAQSNHDLMRAIGVQMPTNIRITTTLSLTNEFFCKLRQQFLKPKTNSRVNIILVGRRFLASQN